VSRGPTPEGGDAACWLDRVCEVCGRIPDRGGADHDGRDDDVLDDDGRDDDGFDDEGRCASCRRAW
jgi:hypothetical protein